MVCALFWNTRWKYFFLFSIQNIKSNGWIFFSNVFQSCIIDEWFTMPEKCPNNFCFIISVFGLKMQIRNNSICGQFSRSIILSQWYLFVDGIILETLFGFYLIYSQFIATVLTYWKCWSSSFFGLTVAFFFFIKSDEPLYELSRLKFA